jgi:hypothetical protein
MRRLVSGIFVLFCLLWAAAEAPDTPLASTRYHLTARPWKPLATPHERYLDALEGLCRFTIRHQDASGAIIDPFLHREHQYATPYFAFAAGTLAGAGRARDLLPNGVRAMEHATQCFSGGRDSIPDQHGEFFLACLTEALDVYAPLVPAATLARWRGRMRLPRAAIVKGSLNNWETYAMKGEWLRARAELVNRETAVAYVEEAWRARRRARFAAPPFRLYHDRTSNPDTLSVEAVGRGNLLALTALGYDGPSAGEIRGLAEAGTHLSLLLQDPSGQVPANGRTDDHVWVDIGYTLAFEVMAERSRARGDMEAAGQFRHAAMLGFQSAGRWRRDDGPWAGSYFVTKNRFDPALRVGYQDASQYSNYNGSMMFHLAEAYHARTSEIAERPSPAEIGGYALALDSDFAAVFAGAGGMQLQANLRGQVGESSGNRWTPLGAVRFSRAGWDTRLGPSDGALTEAGGVSFAPAFEENGRWLRLADLSARYEGVWSVQFVHPLLVRCAIDYRPKPGQAGPRFRNEFILTPDGILSTVRKTSGETVPWGVTWPLLENDGTPLSLSLAPRIASTAYPGKSDRENFLALDAGSRMVSESPLRSTYGDLRPVRVIAPGSVNRTWIYPSGPGDPPADAVLAGFTFTEDGFASPVGRVRGMVYVGRSAAGGFGDRLDLGAGRPAVRFSRPCGFLLQLENGGIAAVETDRAVTAEIGGGKLDLRAYEPLRMTAPIPRDQRR